MPTPTTSPLRTAIEKHLEKWSGDIAVEIAAMVEPDIEWEDAQYDYGHDNDVRFDGTAELVLSLEQFGQAIIDYAPSSMSADEAASVAAIKALLPEKAPAT